MWRLTWRESGCGGWKEGLISWNHKEVDKLWSTGQIQLLPGSVNEVLLGHGHACCFCIACGCFHTTRAEGSSCDRDPMAHGVQNTCSLALYRKGLQTSGLGRRQASEMLQVPFQTTAIKQNQ